MQQQLTFGKEAAMHLQLHVRPHWKDKRDWGQNPPDDRTTSIPLYF